MKCLDENSLAALADGLLDDSATGEIESHIDRCPRCAELAAAFGRAVRSASDAAPYDGGEAVPGDQLGRYRVLGWLGRGAMGQVYLAEDPSLGRRVALKLVSAGGDAGLEERLEREARAMAQLSDQPHVVTVYDVGSAGGRTFIAMELVRGTALDRTLAATSPGWREVVRMFLAAGRGLAAAHQAGIVHRDFKPSNVLVGDDGRIKVGDFGLAVSGAAASGGGSHATATAGTPAYMAPEQHRGEPADAASDQFSFAVALWEALYGERPFAGGDVAEIRDAVLVGERREPPRSPVPAKVARILLRALAADPGDRHPSMAAMLEALEAATRSRRRWLGAALLTLGLLSFGAVTLASIEQDREPCPAPTDRLAAAWGAKERAAVAATVAAAAPGYVEELAGKVLGGLDRYGDQWLALHRRVCRATHVRHEQSEALLDVRMACLDRRLADLGQLARLLGSDRALVDRAARAVAGLPDLERCLRGAEPGAEAAPATPKVAAAAARARAQLLAGRSTEAARGAEALEGIGELRSAAGVELALLVARAETERGHFKAAEERYKQAAEGATAIGDDDSVADAWIGLTDVTDKQGRYDAASTWAAAAEREVLRRRRPDDPQLGVIRSIRAAVLFERGEVEKAAAIYERATTALGDDPEAWPLAASAVFTNAGAFWLSTGELDKAEKSFERAAAICSRELGPRHPQTLMLRRNLAHLRLQRGDPRGAKKLHLEVIEGLEAVLKPGDPALSVSHQMLAEALIALGELPAAEEQLDLASRGMEDLPPTMAATLHHVRGRLRLAQNRLEEALAEHREALALYRAASPNHPAVGREWAQVGMVLGQLERLEEAETELTGAVRFIERRRGADSMELVPALDSLAQIKIARGDCRGGTPILERILEMTERAYGRDSFHLASQLIGLGDCASQTGHHARGLRYLRRALAIRERAASSPVKLAEAHFEIARVQKRSGHHKAARASTKTALAIIEGHPEASWLREEIEGLFPPSSK